MEKFEFKSKFVNEDELIDGVPFLKIKDDSVKDITKEDRIIDAYTLYILNAFTNPRMNAPSSKTKSTEINNASEEVQITVEQFILNNFINCNDGKDRLHTDRIRRIVNEKSCKCDIEETGRLVNRIGIGKYNSKCNIHKCSKGGFDFVKYVNETV